ncbi:MAG: ribbon-helix-helix domain-containing protein [Alphaproteobacteria bacterium]
MRGVTIGSRRTSIRLEPELWRALDALAAIQGTTINDICASLDRNKGKTGLTSALRVYIVTRLAGSEPLEGLAAE